MQRVVVLVIAATLFATGTVLAQGAQFRAADNPFQEGFDYVLGDPLAPNVEVEGLRWSLVRMALRGGSEVEAGKPNAVEITVELESVRSDSATAQIILLLEDAQGNPLERVPLNDIKVSGGRFKSDVQKTKVEGDALNRMTRLYLFCEVVK